MINTKHLNTAVYILLFLTKVVYAQSSVPRNQLLQDAEKQVYTNPNEVIKVSEHVLATTTDNAQKSTAYTLLVTGYLEKGAYGNAIPYIYEMDNFSTENEYKLNTLLFKSHVAGKLHLKNQFLAYITKLDSLKKKINDKDKLKEVEANILSKKIDYLLETQEFTKALDLIKINAVNFTTAEQKQQINIASAIAYLHTHKDTLALTYLNVALNFSLSRKNAHIQEKAILFNELGSFYFLKKQHKKAIDFLKKALDEASKINHIKLLNEILNGLSINYLAINDKENYRYYNNEFLATTTQLEQLEQEAVNTAFNEINKEQDTYYEEKEKETDVYTYSVWALLLLVVIIITAVLLKKISQIKRDKEIVRYLEIRKKEINKPIVKKEAVVKNRINIPKETEKMLLNKLENFEQSEKYLSKDISLAVLAGQFDTNTKYLSAIINEHYQVNFNSYINSLRVNYIIDKLKTDNNFRHYKISYLAKVSGFSSHSSFATVFKSITGITPVTFLDLLNVEAEEKTS